MLQASLAAREACAHCGLLVFADGVGERARFCCTGCAHAFELIHTHGLGQYYASAAARSEPCDDDARLDYAGADADAFLQRSTRELPGGLREITVHIEGLHCAACVWLLERLPRVVAGVRRASVHWKQRSLTVAWDPVKVPLSEVLRTLAQLGYAPALGAVTRSSAERGRRRDLARLAVAGAAAGNNMLIVSALYFGMFSQIGADAQQLLRWASCVVGLVALLGPGWVFFRGALAAVRARSPHMDLPVALALGVGGVAGLVNTIRGSGDVYFDTLSVLVFLLLIGRWLQAAQQRTAAEAVDVLANMTPKVARKFVAGRWRDVPAAVLETGDIVLVRSGEIVPCDGVVTRGDSLVDEQVLTGESRPIAVATGYELSAGTLNVSTPLEVRITATGEATRMGRVFGDVNTHDGRSAVVQLADRIGGYFVGVVLVCAAVTFVYWAARGEAAAVDYAVALLIVACPCALALATPLALSVGMANAARHKILIKDGNVLERLSTAGTLWLDKTGTLTQGRYEVQVWQGSRGVCALVAALEMHASHPVARALAVYVPAKASAQVQELRQFEHGIAAIVDGSPLAAGNASFIAEHARIDNHFVAAATAMIERGLSPVFIASGGTVVALAGVGDALRPDAKQAVEALRARGWCVGILSGDAQLLVEQVGQALGIARTLCHGGLLPADKARIVRATKGTVVMVGDGVNDSPALAIASVGIAVRGGAEASLVAATVYLARSGLTPILELVRAAQRTRRVILRNFSVSIGYNLVAVGLAAAGLINPLIAAGLMPLSSLTMVGLSLAQRWPREVL